MKCGLCHFVYENDLKVYDERSHERYARPLRELLGSSARVLDVGGGDGHMAEWWRFGLKET